MRLNRSIGLILLLVWAVSEDGRARGADSPAATALKDKGLTKSGHVYVIEAEAPVLVKMKETRATLARYAALAERQAQAEQATTQLNQMEERRIELQAHLDDLNQQINLQGAGGPQQGGNLGRMAGLPQRTGSPLIAERDQVRSVLSEISAEQKTLKAQTPLAKDRTALDDNVKKGEEAYKAALAALRPMVDEVVKKYADLAADESVKKAMDELKATTKGKVNLGPSDAFLAGAKQLDQAERQFLGKKAPASATKKKAKAKR